MARLGDFPLSESHAKLIWAGVKPETRRGYDTAIRSYRKVCRLHQIDRPFPATVRTLSVYVTALAFGEPSVKRVKHTTISKYLSAIRSVHVDLNMPTDVFGNEHVRFLIQGASNLFPFESTDKREPMTPNLLEQMLTDRAATNETLNTRLNLDAAFTLAFAAFLRMGEFTWPDADALGEDFSRRHVAQKHITFLPDYFLLTLPMSKTDKGNQGVTIPIAKTGGPLCPYAHMKRLFDSRPYNPEAPLFALANGTFSRHTVITAMQRRIGALGTPPQNYLGHSFRKGAAQEAARAGLTEEEIKLLGRWKGTSVKRYFTTSPDRFLLLQRRVHRSGPIIDR